jgi:hypothetical protein
VGTCRAFNAGAVITLSENKDANTASYDYPVVEVKYTISDHTK